MEKRTCFGCHYWEFGVCTGNCGHPKGMHISTDDNMVFYDAGKDCPLNSDYYRTLYLQDVQKFESDLKVACSEQGIKGAVVGISGGKDSTIVAKLMSDILGKENVLGVLMPNGKQADIDDAYEVVKLLDIPYTLVNISDVMNSMVSSLNGGVAFVNTMNEKSTELSDAAFINIAPRIRMTVLYSIAQSMGQGWRVIGTTNKSEEYVGWLTKWGDGGCDFEPIIEFTVTELMTLGTSLGLPKNLVYKTPVDGLTPLSDEDRLGFSYSQLDSYINNGTSDNEEIDKKIERMHLYSEHKRTTIPRFIPNI